MKRFICQAGTVLLLASMMLSIASCGKKNNTKKATVVAEDTPWFDINTIDVDSGADPEKEIECVNHEFCGSDMRSLLKYLSKYNTFCYESLSNRYDI